MKIKRKYLRFTEDVVESPSLPSGSFILHTTWTANLIGWLNTGEWIDLSRTEDTLEGARVALTEAAREQGVEIV